jgi:signal peptidase I
MHTGPAALDRRDGLSSDQIAAKPSASGDTWGTVAAVLQALLIALLLRTFLFESYNIPSGSLMPTLLVGDYLFVSKISYGYSKYSLPCNIDLGFGDTRLVKADLCSYLPSGRLFTALPQRGDIVVFKVPTDNQTDFVKRVIGLPGDTVQMRQGELYINGQKVARQLVGEDTNDEGIGRFVHAKIYRETLPGGATHLMQTLSASDPALNNTQVFTVPPDHLFMMGDNRDNSADSRVGFAGDTRDAADLAHVFVPMENVVGKAEVIYFSIKTKPGEPEETESALQIWRWPETVRWGRLFNFIR